MQTLHPLFMVYILAGWTGRERLFSTASTISAGSKYRVYSTQLYRALPLTPLAITWAEYGIGWG